MESMSEFSTQKGEQGCGESPREIYIRPTASEVASGLSNSYAHFQESSNLNKNLQQVVKVWVLFIASKDCYSVVLPNTFKWKLIR